MEAARRQSTTLQGLSRFLVEHERCGAGFDVSHPAGLGSGHISIVCRGCGARHDYATATIEFEREIEFAPVPIEPHAPASPHPPPSFVERLEPLDEAPGPLSALEDGNGGSAIAPPLSARRNPVAEKDKRKKTRDRAITAGLLVFAAAALAFAAMRLNDSVNGTSTPSTAMPVTRPVAPVHHPHGAPRVRPGPIAPPHKRVDKPRPAPSPVHSVPLRTVTTAHFAITVPAAWTQRNSGGGLLLASGGAEAVSVQVFYEDDPSLSEQEMASQTASFLRSRDPGASISSPRAVRIGGQPGFKLSARGPAGSQTGLAVLAGPYRYLAVQSVDPGTNAALRGQATSALNSFRPR